jgi:hypothetical protein
MNPGDEYMQDEVQDDQSGEKLSEPQLGSIFPPRNVKAELCFYGFVLAMFTVSRIFPKKIKHVHKLPKNKA